MNIQRRYHDVRVGMTTVSPIVAISNFLLLAYNFSILSEILPFEVFTVLFVVGSIIVFMFIGGIFRKKQYKIDNAIQYENNPELVKTNLVIMECLKNLPIDADLKKKIDERIMIHKSYLRLH